jgi:hypothetical protein
VACLAVSAMGQTTIESILGDFHQAGSPVCGIYSHTMAFAQTDPDVFAKLVESRPAGWAVNLCGKKFYVPKTEVENSIKNGFSGGNSDNLITVYSVAVSMQMGGFDHKTGKLGYGDMELYKKLIGTGHFTGYGEDEGPSKSLDVGLERLSKVVDSEGIPTLPSVMGFGGLDKETIPDVYEQVSKISNFGGGHVYAVARYDAKRQVVVLRNPYCPKTLVEVPVDLLKRIPCGIDFMEDTI